MTNWNDPGADPIADIRRARAEMIKLGPGKPNTLIISREAIIYFMVSDMYPRRWVHWLHRKMLTWALLKYFAYKDKLSIGVYEE